MSERTSPGRLPPDSRAAASARYCWRCQRLRALARMRERCSTQRGGDSELENGLGTESAFMARAAAKLGGARASWPQDDGHARSMAIAPATVTTTKAMTIAMTMTMTINQQLTYRVTGVPDWLSDVLPACLLNLLSIYLLD